MLESVRPLFVLQFKIISYLSKGKVRRLQCAPIDRLLLNAPLGTWNKSKKVILRLHILPRSTRSTIVNVTILAHCRIYQKTIICNASYLVVALLGAVVLCAHDLSYVISSHVNFEIHCSVNKRTVIRSPLLYNLNWTIIGYWFISISTSIHHDACPGVHTS